MSECHYKYRRYLILLGAFLIQLTIGTIYTFGNINSIFIDYMRNNSLSGDSVTHGNTVWIIGAVILGVGASLSLGGYLEDKIGTFKTVLLGGWLMSLNVGLMALTMKTYLSVVIITFGIFGGFGTGFAYGVSLRVPIKYFPNKEGLIFGITITGIGVSAIIFNAIQDFILIDENGVKDPKNLPKSFIILASIYAVIQLIGSMLLKLGSKNKNEERFLNSVSIQSTSSEYFLYKHTRFSENYKEIEPHQLIFEFDYWILWIILFLNSFWVYFISAVYSKYADILGIQYNNDKGGFTSLSIVMTVCNCIGRIFWGYLIDKKSFKIIMLIITLTSSVLHGTLTIMNHIQYYLYTKYIYEVWIGLILFINSGNYTIFPAMCVRLFGRKNFIFNYGMLYTSCSVAGTIVSIITLIYSSSSIAKIFYRNMFIIGGSMSLLAAVFTLLFRGKSLIRYRF